MKMIHVLVVDDSAFSRKIITNILESIPDVRVADTASDGAEALKKTMRLRPDLITLDLEMPHMDGFTFLRWLMSSMPTPVIVISAQEEDDNVFRALDLGAIDFVAKPVRRASTQLEDIRKDLLEKVLAVPLLSMSLVKERMQPLPPHPHQTKTFSGGVPRMIGIAASTGGPPAIQRILEGLPTDFDVPVLIAQHMPAGFTTMFALRLNKYTSMNVREAQHGDLIEPGNVFVAPGGKHLTVENRNQQLFACVKNSDPEMKYSPSADLLLTSMAAELQTPSLGAILTGMGDDGKEGLKRIKEKGGITIAESDQTAIIFGMPQEAIKAGIVDYILPLPEIAEAISVLCKA